MHKTQKSCLAYRVKAKIYQKIFRNSNRPLKKVTLANQPCIENALVSYQLVHETWIWLHTRSLAFHCLKRK